MVLGEAPGGLGDRSLITTCKDAWSFACEVDTGGDNYNSNKSETDPIFLLVEFSESVAETESEGEEGKQNKRGVHDPKEGEDKQESKRAKKTPSRFHPGCHFSPKKKAVHNGFSIGKKRGGINFFDPFLLI